MCHSDDSFMSFRSELHCDWCQKHVRQRNVLFWRSIYAQKSLPGKNPILSNSTMPLFQARLLHQAWKMLGTTAVYVCWFKNAWKDGRGGSGLLLSRRSATTTVVMRAMALEPLLCSCSLFLLREMSAARSTSGDWATYLIRVADMWTEQTELLWRAFVVVMVDILLLNSTAVDEILLSTDYGTGVESPRRDLSVGICSMISWSWSKSSLQRWIWPDLSNSYLQNWQRTIDIDLGSTAFSFARNCSSIPRQTAERGLIASFVGSYFKMRGDWLHSVYPNLSVWRRFLDTRQSGIHPHQCQIWGFDVWATASNATAIRTHIWPHSTYLSFELEPTALKTSVPKIHWYRSSIYKVNLDDQLCSTSIRRGLLREITSSVFPNKSRKIIQLATSLQAFAMQKGKRWVYLFAISSSLRNKGLDSTHLSPKLPILIDIYLESCNLNSRSSTGLQGNIVEEELKWYQRYESPQKQ